MAEFYRGLERSDGPSRERERFDGVRSHCRPLPLPPRWPYALAHACRLYGVSSLYFNTLNIGNHHAHFPRGYMSPFIIVYLKFNY
jgi:hypothetical protein